VLSFTEGAIRKVKRGCIIYRDKFNAYAGSVIYGFKHERIYKSIKIFLTEKVYIINGIEVFWSYAKERLYKFLGVSRKYFVDYLKKPKLRYNFRANLSKILQLSNFFSGTKFKNLHYG
jgi:transposase